MIMLMLGTSPYSFRRLVEAVDDLAGKLHLDVFMQLGHTAYVPKHCRATDFLSHDDVLAKIATCEYLIVQGGAGSISDGLRAGKKVIAVPRYPCFNECPAWQEELVRVLEVAGCVIGVYDIAKLEEAVGRLRTFIPKALPANDIPAIIADRLITWGFKTSVSN